MIVIRGGIVLPGAGSAATAADVLIEGGRIARIGPPGMPAPEAGAILDASDRLLTPGLVNAHTHSHYSFGKGLGDRWTLEMLLNAAPGITGGLTSEDLHFSTLLCAMEMVRKGCTACYDLVIQAPAPSLEVTKAIGQAYQAVGIRAVIAFQMADTTFWQSIPDLIDAIPVGLRETVLRIAATPWEQSLSACQAVLGAWPFSRDLIRPALAPTIPMLCSDPFLTGACQLAREHGIGLHTHLAESKVQAVTAKRRYGQSLTAHLDRLGYLGPNFTAAHAVWLDDEDIRRLADHGCSIAHNPESNLRLGNGIAPVQRMRQAGLTVGIGTDASTCSDQLNMFEAMRLASLVSRATTPCPDDWLGADDVLRMATTEGARAGGFERIGRIEAGGAADLVFLDLSNLNYVPFNSAGNQLVYCENGSAVDSVMVDGRLILDRGRFVNVDEAAVIRGARTAAARLAEKNAGRRLEFSAIERIVSQFCVGLAATPHHVHRYVG
jgi:5-methylthioadenosine/S-adenosylhomocysteine deaminase